MNKSLRPIIFATPNEWETWLKKNHEVGTEVWVTLAKKGTNAVTVTYDEALEIALCWGWIDGLTKRIDDTYYKIRFTPRGPKSNWSARNIEIVGRLLHENKMKPAGLRAVTIAQKNGKWPKTSLR